MTDALDLDSSSSWHRNFKDFLYAEETWRNVQEKLAMGEDLFNEFLAQITYSEESVRDDLARHLRSVARAILKSRHSHVTGYHGCRPRDRDSYSENGILPSDTSALISEARSIFSNFPGLEDALQDICREYINHNEGRVGLLLSEVYSRSNNCKYKEGSELIRSVAFRLGTEAESLYASKGKPTVIKCIIPVDWLDKYTTFPMIGSYANKVIVKLIRMRLWPEEELASCGGGYYLNKVIPPQNIIEFIEC